jgi:hypothetical protein
MINISSHNIQSTSKPKPNSWRLTLTRKLSGDKMSIEPGTKNAINALREWESVGQWSPCTVFSVKREHEMCWQVKCPASNPNHRYSYTVKLSVSLSVSQDAPFQNNASALRMLGYRVWVSEIEKRRRDRFWSILILPLIVNSITSLLKPYEYECDMSFQSIIWHNSYQLTRLWAKMVNCTVWVSSYDVWNGTLKSVGQLLCKNFGLTNHL